ncbi:uncharacterized protein LOC122387340 [Amphibalanus amphitrite]|uniref:uncharacterized protein LOC122387340 n=1 Tax=Amphibalanus amphitrite TaxID=1232801 RepID=UPI001C907439|nr:uncharacterized protein LOC122387340 [Amphibalanus amphitrite]
MLIGIDCCVLMPDVVETVGSLQLLKNQFGYCIRGCYDPMDSTSTPKTQSVEIGCGIVVSDINNMRAESMTSLTEKLDEYFVIENLGTHCTPRCGGCKCGKCAMGSSSYTLQEERELTLIKSGLTYDPEQRKFTVHYPWIRDPMKLPNNVKAAEANLRATERRLIKIGAPHAEAYNDQMQDMLRDESEEAADVIIKNSHVDDLIQSVPSVEMALHSAPSVEMALHLAENVQNILHKGGFEIKHWNWIMSGDDTGGICPSIQILSIDKEKILGMCWVPKGDHFLFQVRINFSVSKWNKMSATPELTESNIDAIFPLRLTRRMVLTLSQAARLYDPFGLIIPVTLKGKILLRNLVTRQRTENQDGSSAIGWDDPISDQDRMDWKFFSLELLKLQDVTFSRCLKPKEVKGDPILIIFSDASMHAYGACAYARWELETGHFEARLIAAKNRIAPTRQLTVPRLELCGAVLGCRLREAIHSAIQKRSARCKGHKICASASSHTRSRKPPLYERRGECIAKSRSAINLDALAEFGSRISLAEDL